MNTTRTTCFRHFSKPRGFTLVEIVVVIAVSIILLGLILAPLIQTLQLTRRAQMLAAAQDSARKVLETATRELNSAVFVYDNASHPFAYNTANLSTTVSNDKDTNFLNLEVPRNPTLGGYAVAHAYHCKLDMVPARHNAANGGLTDPTDNDQPIHAKTGGQGSASLSTTGLLFPLAPGSSIIRYFVGLKRPLTFDSLGNKLVSHYSIEDGNTYVLYRAQVVPYALDASGKPKKNIPGDGTIVNELLFAPKVDSTFTPILPGQPELDDPDFFRFVTNADINWLDPQHRTYGSTPASEQNSAALHNNRVAEWMQLVKPLIGAPTVDLLLLPRDYNGNIIYDTASLYPNVVNSPHFDVAHDPVGNTDYPTVKTSVTFAPATIAADAVPGSTTEYASLGVPADAVDNGGLPYVPTVFAAANQSWGYPYNLSLYEYANNVGPLYTTDIAPASSSVLNMKTAAGDLIEYYHSGGASGTGTPVYDITTGSVLQSATPNNFVPVVINPDTGTLNFATPAMPLPNNMNTQMAAGYDGFTRYWSVPDNASLNAGTLSATTDAGGASTPGVIDLTNLYVDPSVSTGVLLVGARNNTNGYNTSPLSLMGLVGGPLSAVNAFVVPGSVRVYGPDATPGPNLGYSVLYTPVSGGDVLGPNQYRVTYYDPRPGPPDFPNATLTFYVNASETLPTAKADGSVADPVKFTFDYQANLAPPNLTIPISDVPDTVNNKPANPAHPLLVKLDYQTRDLLQVNIGVRVYDARDGTAFLAPASGQVQIGNSNR